MEPHESSGLLRLQPGNPAGAVADADEPFPVSHLDGGGGHVIPGQSNVFEVLLEQSSRDDLGAQELGALSPHGLWEGRVDPGPIRRGRRGSGVDGAEGIGRLLGRLGRQSRHRREEPPRIRKWLQASRIEEDGRASAAARPL